MYIFCVIISMVDLICRWFLGFDGVWGRFEMNWIGCLEHSSCTGAVTCSRLTILLGLKKVLHLYNSGMVSVKKTHLAEKSRNKKSNGVQSDLCDLEQVILKPQLQVHHLFDHLAANVGPQLALGRYYPKERRLRKAELLIRRPPRGVAKINLLLSPDDILPHQWFVFGP